MGAVNSDVPCIQCIFALVMEKQYTDLKRQFSIYPPVGATLC